MRVFLALIFSIYFLYRISNGCHGVLALILEMKSFQDDRLACLILRQALALKILQAFKFVFVGYCLKCFKLSLHFFNSFFTLIIKPWLFLLKGIC